MKGFILIFDQSRDKDMDSTYLVCRFLSYAELRNVRDARQVG